LRARRTVVGSGWRLKLRQLEAIDSIVGAVCPITAAGVAAAIILAFLPCCSLSRVIFHPDECFCKDPTSAAAAIASARFPGHFGN
jgi:hypothetical protein